MRRTIFWMTIMALTATAAGTMHAACGPTDIGRRAAFRSFPGAIESRVGAAIEAREAGPESIVGLWDVKFTSGGQPFDEGFAQLHSDGTEIMNSSRDPVTSSFCLGVWKATGARTFKLNHFAISWDNTGKFCTPQAPASNCMVGPANIREEVTVSLRGDSYRGWVTIDQYDMNQNLMVHLTGNVMARRINP